MSLVVADKIFITLAEVQTLMLNLAFLLAAGSADSVLALAFYHDGVNKAIG